MGKPRKHSQKSEYEDVFAHQINEHALPRAVRQYPFAKCVGRGFKADFAWPDERLIVEINGGGWVGGRHNTGAGYEDDMERTAIATALGWRLMGFSTRMVKKGWAIQLTAAALGLKEMEREMANAKRWSAA